jgi:hypothetical protein
MTARQTALAPLGSRLQDGLRVRAEPGGGIGGVPDG